MSGIRSGVTESAEVVLEEIGIVDVFHFARFSRYFFLGWFMFLGVFGNGFD